MNNKITISVTALFDIFEKYFLILLIGLVFGMALWNFQTSPGFWFDEGIIAQAAKNIAEHGIYGIQTAPEQFYTDNFWITTSYSLIWPVALFIKIFGASIWAARLAPLLYLVFFVLVSYFFIKKLYGFRIAVLSSFLLATFSPLYGNGKAVLGEVPGLFWLISGALIYLAYQESKERKFLFFSAFFWGIAVSTKPYYLLFGLSVLFILVFLWLKQKIIDLKTVILFCFIFSLPVFLWIFLSFDFSSLNGFQKTLVFFSNSYGVSSFEPLKNLLRFVTESTPIHFTFLMIFIFAALFVQKGGWRSVNSAVGGFLIFMLISFLWYLKTPGWYRYFFSIHVLAILFFPASLMIVVERTGAYFQKERMIKILGKAIIGALIIFQAGFLIINYNQFFRDDLLRLKDYAEKNISDDSSVFIMNLPEAAFLLNDKNLYQYIFINENLAIKSDRPKRLMDYIIVGSSDDKFILGNKNLIDFEYVLEQKIGHYNIYKNITRKIS
ncbi:MAG: glycosyltransferase family 39 protein [Candidatus Niyogibacteria bacterium]|nr:glycosyltransferase family 39 protein [Candidatus Niyogibacteria bacterium]